MLKNIMTKIWASFSFQVAKKESRYFVYEDCSADPPWGTQLSPS